MKSIIYFATCLILITSCIGDDIIEDFVQPEIRIASVPLSLAAGEPYQLSATLFGNTGMATNESLTYMSDDPSIATVSNDGIVLGISKGEVDILVTGTYEGETLNSEVRMVIDEVTIEAPDEKIGTVATTSTYPLSGSFTMSTTESGIRIDFADDYIADTRLPGLYIYLTNNKSTNVGALELEKVSVFEGEHSYLVDGVTLDDFSHILYFCKPFSVKVGDGEILDK